MARTVVNDAAIIEDVRARLRARSVFAEVHDGPPYIANLAQLTRSEAFVEMGEDEEEDRTADTVLHTLFFSVWVAARASSRTTTRRKLARLKAAAHASIDGKALAGVTYAHLTKVTSSSAPEDIGDPGMIVELRCRATYRVAGQGAHDDSDPDDPVLPPAA